MNNLVIYALKVMREELIKKGLYVVSWVFWLLEC